MTLEIHDLAWDKHNKVTGLNQLMGAGSPTVIYMYIYINNR